jgi:hypothetical protein|tara:strand:+ start:23463 stop:30737 length:7275 start_codon:yes stop_codon:yes gene_type:complete
MAELKRDFSGAKMNKDMDERVVQPGQYRDANNIQVSTSDGSDVGALQALLGNKKVASSILDDYSTCVGVLNLPEKDFIYYFIAGAGDRYNTPLVQKDYIIEYDTIQKTIKYVFVDIFSVKQTQVGANSTAGNHFFTISGGSFNTSGVRVGMNVTGTFSSISLTSMDNVLVTDIVYDGSNWKVYHDYQWETGGANIAIAANTVINFSSERILNFQPRQIINDINHLDGMLFWTDGVTEPKKIHIERSLRGTGGNKQANGWNDGYKGNHAINTANTSASNVFQSSVNNANFHTRLVISNEWKTGLEVALNRTGVRPVYVNEEHITVIKKSPKFPLEIKMSTTSIDRTPEPSNSTPTPIANLTYSSSAAAIKFTDANSDPLEAGDVIAGFNFSDAVDFRTGDKLILVNDVTLSPQLWDADSALVRVTVTGAPSGMPNNGGSTGPYELTITAVNKDVPDNTEIWLARLEDDPALFEFKFPRFSYRWKYQDGEYSTFAPWTRTAFIPGDFDYLAKKGYNLGMRNRLRTLVLKNYFHEFALVPQDVVQVDLLYKEETSSNVYTVKEITRKDAHPLWPDRAASQYSRGEFILTSEMIHAVVPSNQMLRPWDNVPKSAKTQEITGNRLVFANYKQNYDVTGDIDLDIGFRHNNIANTFSNDVEVPEESLKTLRTYQVGVVFADKFGRESPVLVPKNKASVTLEKKWSTHSNKLTARLKYPAHPPSWAKYMRYYVKETSNEYYNLSMDRWYDAEDGNVWLSFPSAERNKVDADTYLILKNEHDSNKPVFEAGRYKIIAIEPDAPLFVKTKKKSHGAATTTNQNPTALQGATNILIADGSSTEAFQSAFGGSFMADIWAKASPGTFFARLTGTVGANISASRWVGVVSIKKIGSGSTAERSIKLDSSIGDTADFSNILTGTVGYKLELREDVVTNLPEFDGRFFVKIYKDLLLQQAVMKEQDLESAFTIVKSFNLGFIVGVGNHSRHPSNANPTGSTGGVAHVNQYHNHTWARSGWGNANFNNSNVMNDCNARDRTKNWWEDVPHNFWFIDAVGYRRTNHTSGTATHSGAHGVHSSHNGGLQAPGEGGNTGNGGMSHWSSSSIIQFGIMKWSGHNSTSTDFKNTISTPGTIFRFRADPAQTPYLVVKRKGYKQVKNYVIYDGSCAGCDSGWGSCARLIINVEVQKFDGGGPIDWASWDPLSAFKHDGHSTSAIDILTLDMASGGGDVLSTENPAIWETEPKEDIGLDIWYEASGSFPLDITHVDNELFIPLKSTFTARDSSGAKHVDANGDVQQYTVNSVNSRNNDSITGLSFNPSLTSDLSHDSNVKLERYDKSNIILIISKASGNYAAGATTINVVSGKSPRNEATNASQPWRAPHFTKQDLGWTNVWQFGNGIESDRVRDDYNAPQLKNGVKASTVLAEPYAEEHRSSGFIFSGIFNSTSGVNNLNQFIQAEPITKDINPSHGTIQRIVARNTDTLVFCEDKVLNMLTSKDAMFNADGNSNVTSNNSVLGQPIPIPGDYGISTNPESLAVTPTGMYWVDQMRGTVLALKGKTEIREISTAGMRDYFNDNLRDLSTIIGTYDDKKQNYNVTMGKRVTPTQFRATTTTVTWSEAVKGWTSFKSFGPELGTSLNNEYYTFNKGNLWQHHTEDPTIPKNNFYGGQYYSDVTLLFNDQPGSVKSFNTVNYEGTRARVTPFTTVNGFTDKEYYNLTAKTGWYVDNMFTNLQEVLNLEFKDKEGKYFSTVKGVATTLSNLDEKEFSVQGLGNANTETTGTPAIVRKIYIQPSPTSQINGAGTNWDTTADSGDFQIILGTQLVGTSGDTIPADQFVNSTMNNLSYNAGGGVYQYSGLDLTAKNARVPNGVSSIIGSGNSVIFRYTKPSSGTWSADPLVKYVEFSNNGIANDPANTINIKVVADTFTMPAADKFILVDVDYESGRVNPPGVIDREACFRVTRPNDSNVTVTYGAISGVTTVANAGFLSPGTGFTTNKHSSSTVTQGQSSLIAQYTVVADSGYYLLEQGLGNDGTSCTYFTHAASAPWENYYNLSVINVYGTGNAAGKIISATASIFYSPPVGVSGLDPDPISGEGGFCAHLHDIRLDHLARPVLPPLSQIQSVGVQNNYVQRNTNMSIGVNSSAAGTATISVQKMNAANTAATHSYNFSTGAFVAIGGEQAALHHTLTFVAGTLQQVLQVTSPDAAESFKYSVIMTAGTGDNGLALNASVPSALNALTFESLQLTGASTFTPAPITNMIAAGSATIPTATELSTGYNIIPFSFTYTRVGGRSLVNNGNGITAANIKGAYQDIIMEAESAGATNLHVLDTTGIKVGMNISDAYISNNRIPANSKVTAVVTNDSITIDNAITAPLGGTFQGTTIIDTFLVDTGWEYELVSSNVSMDAGNTVATITGSIKIVKYGRSTPNGNIVLHPNFLTTT